MHQPAATYRTHVSDLIGASELKSYYRTNWRRTVFTFFHIWLALGLSLGALPLTSTLPLFARIPLWAFLVVFIGSRLNAIAVQVHEASHFLLFEHKRLNHWFCNLLGAYWILNDVESYWHVHKNHHLHLHETNDPDRDLYLIPDRPIRILAVVACDFFWVTAFRRVLAYLRNRPATGRAENADVDAVARGGHFAGKVAAQSFVLLLFFWMFAWPYAAAYYFVFWLVPLFSIFPLFIRLRIVTEHFADALHESDDRKPFISRTTVSNVLEDYFIGSQMQYHMEHHLYQNIPHYMLVRLHRELVRRGFFERNRENQYNLLSWGYLRFWRQMISDMRRR
ncbi:MAG: fatty acid desaturase [Planctomycetaceae bacterium]